MMRSLFAGVSGLRNHQIQMDVIGNNIANVNTVGFKQGRVSFQDVLSQTLQGASAATGGRGGTNPVQIGLGMGLSSIDTLFTDGSMQATGKQTDLAIQGSGFFVLSDGHQNVYTRAGAFDFDKDYNFIVPGTGYKVMGWLADGTGVVNDKRTAEMIELAPKRSMGGKATTSVEYANNLSADASVGDTAQASITVYDGQGNAHRVSGTFTKLAVDNTATPPIPANTWSFTVTSPTSDSGATVALSGTTRVTFNANGTFSSSTAGITMGITPAAPNGAGAFTLTPDFSSLTQYSGDSTVAAVDQDGYAPGDLNNLSIDTVGNIIGRYTNGQTQTLARVALATFYNPAGLTKVGESLFGESPNSGTAQTGTSGTNGLGSLNSGTLEMSNVDLAQEFSNMIITQRGFQANSKIITAADEMLQELTNLKR